MLRINNIKMGMINFYTGVTYKVHMVKLNKGKYQKSISSVKLYLITTLYKTMHQHISAIPLLIITTNFSLPNDPN